MTNQNIGWNHIFKFFELFILQYGGQLKKISCIQWMDAYTSYGRTRRLYAPTRIYFHILSLLDIRDKCFIQNYTIHRALCVYKEMCFHIFISWIHLLIQHYIFSVIFWSVFFFFIIIIFYAIAYSKNLWQRQKEEKKCWRRQWLLKKSHTGSSI